MHDKVESHESLLTFKVSLDLLKGNGQPLAINDMDKYQVMYAVAKKINDVVYGPRCSLCLKLLKIGSV